jgi:ribosome-associated protein
MPPLFDIAGLAPWIEWSFDRAAGPGGQNVNKLNTRATLWFDLDGCALLRPVDRSRVRERLASRLSADGRLRIVAQQGRTQSANIAAAQARLIELLERALHVPKPRIATRPTRASHARRLATKRRRSDVKRLRGERPGGRE